MTTIEKVHRELAGQRGQVMQIAELVRNAGTVDEVQSIRARTAAVREWVKIHKQTKAMRLELLEVEIAALIRIFELGGSDELTRSEAEAAEWFAKLDRDQLSAHLADFANVTTAAGLHRAVMRADESDRRYRQETAEWASRFSTSGAESRIPTEQDFESARRYVATVTEAFTQTIDDFTEVGEPFTVAEVADSVLLTTDADWVGDSALVDGLRSVIRKSVASARVEFWEGVSVPRFITARVMDGDGDVRFVRIPVMNARLDDVRDMVTLRRAQIEQDVAALAVLEKFAGRLEEHALGDGGRLVGELMAGSVKSEVAA